MKKIFSILFFLALLLAGQASGSYWFKVIDVSPINMTPNSEANFTVAVKGLGSQGGYVQLVFRNVSQGLNISCQKITKYVFSTGVTKFNCTVRAGDVAPGNLSFEVVSAAMGSRISKMTAYVEIEAANQSTTVGPPSALAAKEGMAPEANATTTSQAKNVPGPGVVAAFLALLLAARRR
jgi:hypothetical protein